MLRYFLRIIKRKWATFRAMHRIKPCCRKAVNHSLRQLRPDLIVKQCKVCSANHYELTIDIGSTAARGVTL